MADTEQQLALKVGDILCAHWGYDAVLVDFYEVVAVKPKTVSVRKIKKKDIKPGSHGQSGCVIPQPGEFLPGDAFNRRIPGQGGGVRIWDTCHAYTWDGKPQHWSD